MENIQEMGSQTNETSRRRFLTDSARKAAWVAPALTLMMAASATPARATQKYGNAKKPSGYQFWKMWYHVHRGRKI
jgi:hypothetical protein